MAFLYIDRADKDKNGKFIENINVQYSLGNSQYPDTLEEAHAMLSAQRFEKGFKQKSEPKKPPPKAQNNTKKYINKKDDSTVVSEITLAQTEGVCFCCGKKGHLSNICRRRNKPKAEWHVNNAKEIQHVMQQSNSPSTPSSRTSSAETKGIKNSIFECEELLECLDTL
jgi:hypothetical protein